MLIEQHGPRSQAAWLRARRASRLFVGVLALVCAFLVSAQHVSATYHDMVGYPQLQAQLGVYIPTGLGIEVHHVEALNSVDRYAPNGSHVEFSGKLITNVTAGAGATQATTQQSGHATGVGINFYGNSVSLAPDVSTIQSYDAFHWMGYNFNVGTQVLTPTTTGFLNNGSGLALLPDITSARIANHSWVSSLPGATTNSEVLRRLDYVVERDDFINIVALLNGNGGTDQALLKTGFNEISVGRTNGVHREGTVNVDGTYNAGRNGPELVAPGFTFDDILDTNSNLVNNTSNATAMVSSATAMLLQTAQKPQLSNGTITNRTRTIRHAETSEVIKAVLMAGADRAVDNPRGVDLGPYVINTPNNLDLDFGAGQLNVFNSYNILAASEHDSDQDRLNSVDIPSAGWDYDPNFGGLNTTNNRGSYFFTAANTGDTIHATLAWNMQVSAFTTALSSTTLRDLNLILFDVTNNQEINAVGASSKSLGQNTENIFYSGLVAGNRYEIRVEPGVSQLPFDWDYGLAWRVGDIVPVPEPSSMAVAALGVLSAMLAGRRQRK